MNMTEILLVKVQQDDCRSALSIIIVYLNNADYTICKHSNALGQVAIVKRKTHGSYPKP